MTEKVPIYYWDTCLFLEYFREEAVSPEKKRAITRLLSENKAKENRIVTSVLTHAEAIPRKLNKTDAGNESLYWSYFNGIYLIDEDISRQTINLAREIRDFYFREADPKTGAPYRMVGLGDSIHLATAIIAGVDEFHTRDKRTSGGNLGLLSLLDISPHRKVAGQWDLKILSPEDDQGDLLDKIEQARPN